MGLRSLTLAMLALASFAALAHDSDSRKDSNIQVGVRPFFLVEGMDNSRLKEKLQLCENGPFRRSTGPSHIAVRRCSSPSTPRNPMRLAHDKAPASSSAT